MADIQAFRGIRYDLGHVGSLGDVVAPPYDVIDSSMQDQLYKQHPANVIRLILNREEPGDDDLNNRYTRAAKFLKDWLKEGVLQRDSHPAVYVYHQVFHSEGQQFVRRGFMARIRLEPFGTGRIYPHEETHSAAKADRLKLMTHCKANLSQIFGIYPDSENQAQQILERQIEGQVPLEATDHLGVVHRVWPVTDEDTAAQVNSVMGPKPIYIADGHHRYETACNLRRQIAGEDQSLDEEHPANFVLMMCVSMDDPGMIVLPTHRLFRGCPRLTSEQLVQQLGDAFTVRPLGTSPELAEAVWETIQVEGQQGSIGLFTAEDQRWVLATITETGRRRMSQIAAQQSEPWRGLGVSILHRLIMDDLLDLGQLPKPRYVHLVDEVTHGLDQGDEDGNPFQLAALVMPATLEHIRAISEHGERMPAKSTYFYPKLLSGLVINGLE